MAQSLRRPLCSVVGLSSSFQRRPFTQSSLQWAGVRSAVAVRPKQSVGKSMKIQQKEAVARGEYPSDMGLLQETFIPPIRFPSIFTKPSKFFRFQYLCLRYRLRDLLASLIMKVSSPMGKRWYNRSLKLNRRSVALEAVKLHSRMYTAFAEGNIPQLRTLCADGIFDSFRTRIARRARGEMVDWKLLQNKSAKLVSDRIVTIPGIDGGGIRQAVVRIKSRQKLTRSIGHKKVEATGEKDVIEYMVVQQMIEEWEPKTWVVWGTTRETTLEDCDQWKVAKGNV